MKAIRLHQVGGPESLLYEDAPKPIPKDNQVLVQVHATAITPTELGWYPTFHTPESGLRPFPIILGHEFSGVVDAVGSDCTDVQVGDPIYGLSDWFIDGAQAEYCVTVPADIAPKPVTLDHTQAAAVPISALTAWQALIDRAHLSAGQRVLIHGASGGVGSFAMQLAAATARIGAAKADRFPKLFLTGLLGIANPNLSKLFTAGGDFGVFGPTLTGPLLNAVSLGFQQDAAAAQARQAVAQYKQTILTAFKEVEDALAGVSTAREQAAAQERQVNALKGALRRTNLRYKGGLASYLDVLIAQRNLFDAELALATTHRLSLTSVVQLYKALGGGWSPDEQDQERRTSIVSVEQRGLRFLPTQEKAASGLRITP